MDTEPIRKGITSFQKSRDFALFLLSYHRSTLSDNPEALVNQGKEENPGPTGRASPLQRQGNVI